MTDPNSYCMVKVSDHANKADAQAPCAKYKSGWVIPVIRDPVMLEKLGNLTSRYVCNYDILFYYIWIKYNTR